MPLFLCQTGLEVDDVTLTSIPPAPPQSDEVYTQVGCELMRVMVTHFDFMMTMLETSGLVQVFSAVKL